MEIINNHSDFCKKYVKELDFVKNAEKTSGKAMTITDARRINMYFDLFVKGGFSYTSEEGKINQMKIEIGKMIQCENDYDRWRDSVIDHENDIKKRLWNEMTK